MLEAAESVALIPDRTLGASRYLAASLLLRQALEDAIGDYWMKTEAGLADCSGRVQMVALPEYLDNAEAARDVVYCWNRLSHACHHHVYDLPPSEAEFGHYVNVTRRSIEVLTSEPVSAE